MAYVQSVSRCVSRLGATEKLLARSYAVNSECIAGIGVAIAETLSEPTLPLLRGRKGKARRVSVAQKVALVKHSSDNGIWDPGQVASVDRLLVARRSAVSWPTCNRFRRCRSGF